MKSWLPIPKGSPFSLANIPFGIISTAKQATHRPAIAIGDHALDISVFAGQGGFSKLADFPKDKIAVFSEPTLNSFANLGRPAHRAVRNYLRDVFREDTPYPEILKSNQDLQKAALTPLSEVQTHVPLAIGDYTDFFAGRNHAFNVGTLFRGAANALQPNYYHVPVAYHGRASSVIVSGVPLRRPWGQVLPAPTAKEPNFQPSARLDIELELGMFFCRGNKLGEPIPVDEAEEHIFGYVLMNDWSARDIQQWEYVPLGPFNAKNLGTSISPWVVLADALETFKGKGLENQVELQPYLREKKKDNVININLEVELSTASGKKVTLSRTSSNNLLWSWPQMIAHHTIAGCNLRTGDLLGSGTISGPEAGTYGSILEQTQGGKTPIQLGDGEERKFLADGDTVTIKGWAGEGEDAIGFGEVSSKILEALPRK
ncbi:hypothetical protein CDD81_7545 [Ophiocordyceps australis]|uniref:Fumarylacetoacetase n=1 Tax=Ophiocordyceps australis TaxID=1399860 RepID=A0A2C5Y572_9HYPO|nr:hypothetical protein CDD81_7545 [Ophiocordyceps australis]